MYAPSSIPVGHLRSSRGTAASPIADLHREAFVKQGRSCANNSDQDGKYLDDGGIIWIESFWSMG